MDRYSQNSDDSVSPWLCGSPLRDLLEWGITAEAQRRRVKGNRDQRKGLPGFVTIIQRLCIGFASLPDLKSIVII
jgi:hypothetical protein